MVYGTLCEPANIAIANFHTKNRMHALITFGHRKHFRIQFVWPIPIISINIVQEKIHF